MKKLLICVTLLAASLTVFAKPELKGSPEELRQFLHPTDKIVTLQAEAEEKAYADKAIISLVITTEEKLLSAAISANSNIREAITTQLVSAGIKAEHIKSSKFSTSPQYGWFGKKPDSYKVINRMAISIRDESQLKTVAEVADAKEELELSDIAFEHSKKDQFKNKVKTKALAKIMKQKAFYESKLGVKLTPIGFRDINIGQRGTQGALMLEEAVVTARKRSGSYQDMSANAVAYSKPAPSFDEVLYQVQVYVDFKIETNVK